MLSALCWVPKGFAKSMPDRFKDPELEGEENAEEDANIDDENEDGEDINDLSDDEDVIKKYGLDEYDEEGEESNLAAVIGGMKGLMYKSNRDDPNITLHEDAEQDELEDVLIRPTDSLLVTCVSSEEELSHLDVYVVDEVQNASEPSTYIHHDYLLPAMPLSLAWLNYHPVLGAADPNTAHNMVCVGSFEPGIEIWDLDVMDTPKPVAILGGSQLSHDLLQSEEKKTSLQSKKARHKQLVPDSHRDAVLGLAWNQLQRTVLASCSADHTVKCWDLSKQSALLTLQHHTAAVQCVAWHATEAAMLASGGFDKRVHLTDIRVGKSGAALSVSHDIECVQWVPWSSYHLLVSDEGGNLFAFDIRQLGQKGSKAQRPGQLWQLAAHSEACSGISLSRVPGLMATCSPERDSPVKLWDIRAETSGEATLGRPSCVYSKTKSLGATFSLAFSPDTPHMLAVGGKHGQPLLLNTAMLGSVAARFGASASTTSEEVEIDVYDVNAQRGDEDEEAEYLDEQHMDDDDEQ